MPVTKRQVALGPWPKGMDLRPHYDELDTLSSIQNFDVLDDGTLIARRPFKARYSLSKPVHILGNYSKGVGNRIYALFSWENTTTTSRFFYTDGSTETKIQTTGPVDLERAGRFKCSINYNGKTYFIPSNDSGGTPVGFSMDDPTAVGAVTNIADMPRGNRVFIMGERMIIVNLKTGIIYWSKATDPAVWASPDGGFVKVAPNDEGFIEAFTYRDRLYISRRNELYMFAFATDPAVDGSIERVSAEDGVIDAVVWHDRLFVVNIKGVFEYTNGYFLELSERLDFEKAVGSINTGTAFTMYLNVIGDTLILSGPSFGYPASQRCQYAMNLKTNAWSFYTNPPDGNDRFLIYSKGFPVYDLTTYRMAFGKPYDSLGNGDYHILVVPVKKRLQHAVQSPRLDTVDGTFAGSGPTAISCAITFQKMYFENMVRWKRLHYLWVDFIAGSTENLVVALTELRSPRQDTGTGWVTNTNSVPNQVNFTYPDVKRIRFKGLQLSMTLTMKADPGYPDSYYVPAILKTTLVVSAREEHQSEQLTTPGGYI